MTTQDYPEHLFPSTHYQWRKVKLSGRPRPQETSAAQPHRPKPLRARDPREPIHVELAWRGGAESRWRVKARGRSWSLPGHLHLDDVMALVNSTVQHGDRA
jgi:hypothetical protein